MNSRKRFIAICIGITFTAGVVFLTVPFISSLSVTESTIQRHLTYIDLDELETDKPVYVDWHFYRVVIIKPRKEVLSDLPNLEVVSKHGESIPDSERPLHDEIKVFAIPIYNGTMMLAEYHHWRYILRCDKFEYVSAPVDTKVNQLRASLQCTDPRWRSEPPYLVYDLQGRSQNPSIADLRVPAYLVTNFTCDFRKKLIRPKILMTWDRKLFLPSENNVLSFFIIFGEFENGVNISASKYNFTEVPEDTDIVKYHDGASPEYRDGFRSGYLWEELCLGDPELASIITSAPSCVVIRTETTDKETLDYLRNIVGLVTYFLDIGGVCVCEPQRLKWWAPNEWREHVFLPKEPQPYQHTMILVSEQDDGKYWYHTRGLRLFARPDMSVHDVTEKYSKKVHELMNRFIEYQAYGGIIEDGKNINMEGLPSSMWCEYRGCEEDPEFNNRHIEIHWA